MKEENFIQSLHDSFFGVVDPRRRQEKKDSRMIQEDHTKVANLPDKPLHHEFNQNKYVEHFRDDVYEITDDRRR
jgi:hypothetical protein